MTRKITLMGREFEIRPVSEKELRELSKTPTDHDAHGMFSASEAVIYINKSLNAEAFRRVLLHEIMHATLYTSGLANLLEENMEEATCDVSENWISLFLDLNFIQYLKNGTDL